MVVLMNRPQPPLSQPTLSQPTTPLVHYLLLGSVLLLGLGLRFWQLDSKPLWLDEIITAVFALGRDYREVPIGEFVELGAIAQFFGYAPSTCAAIAERLARDSSHPPLFFCLLHQWLGSQAVNAETLAGAMRSLSVIAGTGAIAAIYLLNRLAFSPAAGLLGASFMAVSPFAVYLSQEARHYTLPMLLITLAMAISVWVLQDLLTGKARLWVWLLWVGVNALGIYSHYFFLLALVAQIVGLLGVWLWRQQVLYLHMGAWLGGAIALIALSYIPWFPTLLAHFSRPETEWLALTPGWGMLAPLYQGLGGWVTLLLLLPVEGQPAWVALTLGILMLTLFAWILFQALRGWQNYCDRAPNAAPCTLIVTITAIILLEFIGIIYGLGKDLTLAPRYNFVYYPGLCALLSVSVLWIPTQRTRFSRHPRQWRRSPDIARKTPALVIALGLLSSAFVVNGLGFQKSFDPNILASRILDQPLGSDASTLASADISPTAVIFHYPTPQELAFGLSVAYRLHTALPTNPAPPLTLAFLPQTDPQSPNWENLPQLPNNIPAPLTLWNTAAPQSRPFPNSVTLTTLTTPITCTLSANARYTLFGVPYQGYQCAPAEVL